MFVVCAQAPGRIDGVLVVLVVEVLITSHSACPLMRAAHKELAQLACIAWPPRRRLVAQAKSREVSYADRWWGDERTSGTFHNSAIVDGLRADKRYIRAIRAQY